MAALAKLYEFLEKKRDEEHIDSMFLFSYDAFSPEESPLYGLGFFRGGK